MASSSGFGGLGLEGIVGSEGCSVGGSSEPPVEGKRGEISGDKLWGGEDEAGNGSNNDGAGEMERDFGRLRIKKDMKTLKKRVEEAINELSMEFGIGIAGSSGNGMSSEAPVETSSVAMVVPSSPLPFGASVGAATMTSFSMPSSIFGSAPRPIPGLETTGDHPVARSPQPNEANDPLVAMVNQAWYHNNYLAINIILEGLGDSLYPVYAGATLAKELWNSLNKKYQAEDAGTKKFIVGKMLDYKMVDSKSVVAQAEELTVIFNKCNEEKVGVSEAFNSKWRPSSTNFPGRGKISKPTSSSKERS
ncbi:unnamed protein product [Cuscuta campestris]|uniref:Uncharacterized protein n=1 Tax=Cuscuta campestris TaxID=132261 RepID=A0A484ML39_9ASTE|nr:unnamed protein product [Cuscuta campestris]